MLNILRIKKDFNDDGFTLIEIIVVIVIIAILATVAIPKYVGAVERSRASEGTYILGTLLSAQERYFLENDSFTSSLGDLDVEIPTPKFFAMPSVGAGCATVPTACATIVRTGSTYTLTIDRNGTVRCAPLGAECTKAGF
jgi:prepilin-type N-terminal cleavage/methylation domain-containing protein